MSDQSSAPSREPDRPKKKRGGRLVNFVGVLLALWGVSAFVSSMNGTERPSSGEWSGVDYETISVSTETVPASVPADQSLFRETVERTRQSYEVAGNDFRRGATRPARAAALCEQGFPKAVSGWRGRIAKLTTNGDGEGVLRVEVGESISLATSNNSLSNMVHETLIPSGSSVYRQLARFEEGDSVKISGQFFPDKDDCVAEQSVTMDGSMTDPYFEFRFSDLQVAD